MASDRGDEAAFRDDLAEILRTKLQLVLQRENLTLDVKQKVLYDLTGSLAKNEFAPRFGFLEQDIVIFDKASIDPNLSAHFHHNSEKDSIVVPRLIIEVKFMGINSHALMTYSNIAARIKGVFTDFGVKYYLLLRYDDKSRETILRHGLAFDRIIQLEAMKDARLSRASYTTGTFHKDLSANEGLRTRFEHLLDRINADLTDNKLICAD